MEQDECEICSYLMKLKRGRIFKNKRETKNRKYKLWCCYNKKEEDFDDGDLYLKTVQIPISRLLKCPLE